MIAYEGHQCAELLRDKRRLDALLEVMPDLVSALREAIETRAATTEWRTDSPEVTGKPERWVRDELCTKWRQVIARASL